MQMGHHSRVKRLLGMGLSLGCLVQAGPVKHGPLVHWNQDPTKACGIVWMDAAGDPGREGKWSMGPAGFGYADGDDATVFEGMRNRYTSLAIRCRIAPRKPDPGARLVLRVNYDDGFIAWLDGREIARRNVVESGGVARAAGSHDAGKWEEIPIGPAELLAGGEGSVLAFQGFNRNVESSDLTLHPVLILRSGAREIPLIPHGHSWEYLAGSPPETDWNRRTLGLAPGERSFELEYRTGPSAPWSKAAISSRPFGFGMQRVFRSELRGLPAAAEVEFRISKSPGGGSEPYRFRMPPTDPSHIRFITGGDVYHQREAMDRMNRLAGRQDPLFVLMGGDLAYANNIKPDRWLDYLDSWAANARAPDGRLIPKVVAIGNHETLGAGYHPNDAPGPEAASLFYSLFEFPVKDDATHVVDFGNSLSLVMLDSGHTRNISAQTAWLRGVLEARRKTPCLFAAYHRPAWGCGTKDDSVEIRREWSPLFEQHRVSAVFEYDHHVFCRSHPIRNGAVDPVNGVPYLGAGAWSVDVRKLDAREVARRPWVARAEARNHFYLIETRPGGFSAEAMDIGGEVFDRIDRAWTR